MVSPPDFLQGDDLVLLEVVLSENVITHFADQKFSSVGQRYHVVHNYLEIVVTVNRYDIIDCMSLVVSWLLGSSMIKNSLLSSMVSPFSLPERSQDKCSKASLCLAQLLEVGHHGGRFVKSH